MTPRSFASAIEKKLAACGDPKHAAPQLAELFRWTFNNTQESTVLKYTLQTELLRWTLDRASIHTRYYDQPPYRESVNTLPGLHPELNNWPVIRRGQVSEHLNDMLADDVTFGAICHTSGCTGPALSVYKSAEELSFIWDYQIQLQAPVRNKLPSLPLVLSIPNFYHGTPIRVPSIGKVFVGGVTDDLLINDIITLLRQRFHIEGHDDHFSIITCLVHQMLFLTNYLLEQGIDPNEFNIKSINIIGGYLTNRGREYLHNAWGAMIFDRFSLTESAGGATRCHSCGYFHLDPHVIGEILDVDSDVPATNGVGRLVLTELYPFVQMQPFIRYDTGDLVRPIESDCHSALTFEFAGKSKNCISWSPSGKTEWLILSVDLLELIDAIPDFRRVEQFLSVHSAEDPSVGSLPIYTLIGSLQKSNFLLITLTIELRYAPHFYPERTTELRNIIANGLADLNPTLASRITEGKVELKIIFAGPNMLKDANILKI